MAASAVSMTTEQNRQRLENEIRALEAEFRARRAAPRPLARSVAAAYRRSIEEKSKQLDNLLGKQI